MRLGPVAAGLAGLLMLAACGDSDDSGSEAIIEIEGATDEGTTDDGATGESESGVDASAASEEEQALAFSACMRDNGVDFPDPTLNADGSVDFGIGPGAGGDGGFNPQDPDFQGAIDECQSELEGATFLPGGGGGDLVEFEDDLLAFAECLRDQGIDVDDPDLDALGAGGDGGGGAGALFGGFDPNDPENADAVAACQGAFTGGLGG